MATVTKPRRTSSRPHSLDGHNGNGSGAAGSSGRRARARPATQAAAGRAGSNSVAKRALKAASRADGSGAGKMETAKAFWRVGRLAWQVARGKRPKAKQLRKATSSAAEVGAKALVAKAPKKASKALAAKAPSKGSKAPLRPLVQTLQHVQLQELPEHVRRAPVQLSIDVAVPLEVAYHEWMKLDSLPEGAHIVTDINRHGESLTGHIDGLGEPREWEAEIRDKRRNESFAWRSTRGSDVAGLITFHRLAERLTRLEVELDVVPASVTEAAALALHFADRRAETELRRFKLRVEMINPDAYPAPAKRKKQKTSKSTKKED